MNVSEWEKHVLLADKAMEQYDHLRGILHYQQALALSETVGDAVHIDLNDRLMISVISCHNMARFWRVLGDEQYEFKYLELASERILTLLPQCPNTSCSEFIESLGCCRKALIEFMKRHPNPSLANLVKSLDSATNCNLIARFRIN
ncbi:DUF2753 family protein [Vibrio casei]|uniref:DUF2753 family protein n=1 Tax=Vibrio casei TaxID=673372 RepID=A0A368LGX1_9VIBR|nr:DUF2753 family protein [Vibrio casei]RCS70002.1 DUF2753 family protein [Vibrio casei]SJN33724.1 hypothetical protein FM109_12020 [Vibrio casei]